MATRTFLKDGRKWQANADGITSLNKTYVIQLDTNNLGENAEFINFSAYGVPAIGASHPSFSYLKVQSYSVEEGEGSEKKLIRVTCNYGLDSEWSSSITENADEVESWGWEAGVEQKEVTYNLLTNKPVLNSANDVFESVPVCDFPAPVFVKVIKTSSRKDWLQYNCKINNNAITVGGTQCGTKTLLASVSEQRIISDPNWKYRYTIQLRYKTNMSSEGTENELVDFGWDIPVVDCGMREIGDDGKLNIIMQVDSETKKPCAVTSPELLNGEGKAVDRGEATTVQPYIFRVQAYETAEFPGQFYSEPS